MEELFDSGYASALGTCDLDKEMLEKLYNWARVRHADCTSYNKASMQLMEFCHLSRHIYSHLFWLSIKFALVCLESFSYELKVVTVHAMW